MDEDGSAEYQFVDVLQPLGIATLELMKGVQNDVEYGETMGDCTYAVVMYLSSALIVTAGGRNSYNSIWLNIPLHFSRHGWIDCGSGYDVQVLQETQI